MADGRRIALIAGASGGIGRAVALRLAPDGFAVVVNYAGNASKAEAVVAEIEGTGGRAIPLQADVARAADVEHLFTVARDTLHTIDVVVNCAGIMPLQAIAGGDVEVFDKAIATNRRGTFLVLRQAAQHLPAGGRSVGGIVEFLRNMAEAPPGDDRAAEAEFFRLHRSASLLQRLIDPKEIAHVVAYLASPLSSATNGAALRAEGGLLRSIC